MFDLGLLDEMLDGLEEEEQEASDLEMPPCELSEHHPSEGIVVITKICGCVHIECLNCGLSTRQALVGGCHAEKTVN